MRVITWKRVGLAATVVVVGGTLAATGRVAARADRATPEPLGAQDQPHGCLPAQTKTPLLDEARKLTYGTIRASEDTEVLWWFRGRGDSTSGLVPGPVGTVWPVDNAHDGTFDHNGIIVAKVEIQGGFGRGGYPKLGLPEGVSYIKVCRVVTGGTPQLHALIIPVSGPLKPAPRAKFNDNRENSPVAKALWEWHPEDDHLCVSCGPWWCELW